MVFNIFIQQNIIFYYKLFTKLYEIEIDPFTTTDVTYMRPM